MKKTILALAAAGLAPLVAWAAPADSTVPPGAATPAPPPAAAPQNKPAPARLEPRTTYGDIARVLSAQPVYEKVPVRPECRLENTGYSRASPADEIPRCDQPGEARERIVAYDVTYQYHGREFRIRMPHDPGEQMAVNVDVRPPMPDARGGNRIPRYRGPY